MVDPRHFAPFNLGDIMAQAESIRGARDDRMFRQQAFEQQQADRSEDRDMRRQSMEAKQREAQLDDYAAAIRWADTPEKWEQAVSVLARDNPDIEQYRGQFQMRERLALELGAMRQYQASAPKQSEGFTLGENQVRYGPNGEVIAQGPAATKYHNIPEGTMAIPVGGAQPGAAPDVESIWQSLIQQESGGRPGVTGPQTPYGRAQGLTQMLPPTAQAMATKLNLPWQPQLMTDASPAGAEYQGRLGRAYFEEGLQKYNGDIEKALMYYHGGPDERLWGPKTRAYAKQVMARAGRSGGLPGGAITNPKANDGQFKVLTEAEAQQLGLPPGKWQRGPNGKIDQVGSNSGQGGATRQQIGAAKQKLNALRPIEGQLARVESAMKAAEEKGWTGWVGGMVPGRFDAESNVFDKSIRNLATLIRQLTRTPGEGAMSDYESRLAEAILPSRTDTPEGRAEAIAGIKDLIANIRAGYEDFLGQPATQSSGSGWGKAAVVGD